MKIPEIPLGKVFARIKKSINTLMPLQQRAAMPVLRLGLVGLAGRLAKCGFANDFQWFHGIFFSSQEELNYLPSILWGICKGGWRHKYWLLSANANSYWNQSVWVRRRNCIITFFFTRRGSWDTRLVQHSLSVSFGAVISFLALLRSISNLLLLLILIPEEVLSEQLGVPSHFEGSLQLVL